jgi:N-methylhydantoinase B
MDVGGALAQPQNSLPDIEINEFAYPVLYLWRRLNQNSGGPGKYRGGTGLDLGWTPWYTTGGQEHTMLSCWQVPPNGAVGGYPGTSSRFTLTSGAGADRALDQGRIPASLTELDAEPQALQGKQFGMIVMPGDVVTLRSGGGGGYGDPLERDPAHVATDLRAGLLDHHAAETSYGVVVADGQVDQAATSARRDAVRAERRAWTREGEHAVRRGPAAERLGELGQWCSPRDGVTFAEFADPDTGALLRTEVLVAEDAS